jgi:hypothetical protein
LRSALYSAGSVTSLAGRAWRRKHRNRRVVAKALMRVIFSRWVLLRRSTFAGLVSSGLVSCGTELATLGAIIGWAVIPALSELPRLITRPKPDAACQLPRSPARFADLANSLARISRRRNYLHGLAKRRPGNLAKSVSVE